MTEHQRRAYKTLFARAIYEGGLPLSWADRPATKRFTEVTHRLQSSLSHITCTPCSNVLPCHNPTLESEYGATVIALYKRFNMQAVGLGTISRRWIAGPGLNAEYNRKKREQEELLKEHEVTPLTLCYGKETSAELRNYQAHSLQSGSY